MHPALSIIVFTVTTGLAYGWLALAIVLDLTGHRPLARPAVVPVDRRCRRRAHHRRPAVLHACTWRIRAMRGAPFMRVRTSWLSREAVLAVLFFPVLRRLRGLPACGSCGVAAALLGWLSVGHGAGHGVRHRHDLRLPAHHPPVAHAPGAGELRADGAGTGRPVLVRPARAHASPAAARGVAAVVFGLLMLALAGKVVYWLKVGLPEAADHQRGDRISHGHGAPAGRRPQPRHLSHRRVRLPGVAPDAGAAQGRGPGLRPGASRAAGGAGAGCAPAHYCRGSRLRWGRWWSAGCSSQRPSTWCVSTTARRRCDGRRGIPGRRPRYCSRQRWRACACVHPTTALAIAVRLA